MQYRYLSKWLESVVAITRGKVKCAVNLIIPLIWLWVSNQSRYQIFPWNIVYFHIILWYIFLLLLWYNKTFVIGFIHFKLILLQINLSIWFSSYTMSLEKKKNDDIKSTYTTPVQIMVQQIFIEKRTRPPLSVCLQNLLR